jgi:hypothetical protein
MHYNFIEEISYENNNNTLLLSIRKVLHIHHKKSPTTKTSHLPNEVDLK